jgi:hypothetical protein
MSEAKRACFWIIGRDNAEQSPAVAVDLHKENGALVGVETFTAHLAKASIADAGNIACEYAAQYGVPAHAVTFDADSTDAFATC